MYGAYMIGRVPYMNVRGLICEWLACYSCRRMQARLRVRYGENARGWAGTVRGPTHSIHTHTHTRTRYSQSLSPHCVRGGGINTSMTDFLVSVSAFMYHILGSTQRNVLIMYLYHQRILPRV